METNFDNKKYLKLLSDEELKELVSTLKFTNNSSDVLTKIIKELLPLKEIKYLDRDHWDEKPYAEIEIISGNNYPQKDHIMLNDYVVLMEDKIFAESKNHILHRYMTGLFGTEYLQDLKQFTIAQIDNEISELSLGVKNKQKKL